MHDLKGSKKLQPSTEDRPIFEDLESSRAKPRTWLSRPSSWSRTLKLSSRTSSRPSALVTNMWNSEFTIRNANKGQLYLNQMIREWRWTGLYPKATHQGTPGPRINFLFFLIAGVKPRNCENHEHKNSELQCKKERKQNERTLTHANQDCQYW